MTVIKVFMSGTIELASMCPIYPAGQLDGRDFKSLTDSPQKPPIWIIFSLLDQSWPFEKEEVVATDTAQLGWKQETHWKCPAVAKWLHWYFLKIILKIF